MVKVYEEKYEAEIFVNDCLVPVKGIAKFDKYYGLTISICNTSEGINLYVFNILIVPNYFAKVLPIKDQYAFSGPRLGYYHDTADMREGPYVNHWFENLEIEIFHEVAGKSVQVKGVANLARSGVDDYWYKGAREGEWKLLLRFSMPNNS